MSRSVLKCENCGAPLMKGAESCVFCGSQFEVKHETRPKKRPLEEREIDTSADVPADEPATPPVYNKVHLTILVLGIALFIFLLKVWNARPFSSWDMEMKVYWSFFELMFAMPLIYFGTPFRIRTFLSLLIMLCALGIGVMAVKLGLTFIYIPCFVIVIFFILFLIGKNKAGRHE